MREASPPRDADDRVADLTQQSLRWVVLTQLVYRVGVTVPAILLNRDVLAGAEGGLWLIGASVLVLDGVLIAVTLAHPTWLSRRPVFFALDMTMAVGTTVAATILLPQGLFLISGGDLMTGFGWGTVGLWTVARGWRTGLVLVLATPVVQLAMALLNGAPLEHSGIQNIIFRSALALINFIVPLLILLAARHTARAVIEEARRAGDLAERVEHLRGLHDTALADLDAIALLAGRNQMSHAERRVLIAETADSQLATLHDDTATTASSGVLQLIGMVGAFADRGLRVDVRGPVGLLDSIEAEGLTALLAASREALQNCLKHAAVTVAELEVRMAGCGVEVEIRDRGIGRAPDQLDGFGLGQSIRSRMSAVGGHALIASNPGSGTSVVLRVEPGEATRSHHDGRYVFRWFPLVALVARLSALPLVLYKSAPLLGVDPLPLQPLIGCVALGQIALIVVLVRRPWQTFPRPLVWSGLAVDFVVAAGLYLAVAVSLRDGEILTSDGATVWIYVFLTTPLAFALRRPRAGIVIGLALIGLLPLGVALNHADLTPAGWGEITIYVLQVVITAGYAAMVTRMAELGVRRAATESDRAGREAARLTLLTELRPRLIRTFGRIATTARADGNDETLPMIREIARAHAAQVRAVLREAPVGQVATARAQRTDAASLGQSSTIGRLP